MRDGIKITQEYGVNSLSNQWENNCYNIVKGHAEERSGEEPSPQFNYISY